MNILRKTRKIEKKINIKRIILIIFFLIMTTFAWFVYYKVLDTGVMVHIASWNIEFSLKGEKIENKLDIAVEKLYPGMEEQSTEINVKNNGEATAKIGYDIEEIYILGNKYEIIKDMSNLEETNKYYLELKAPIVNEEGKAVSGVVDDKERFPFKIEVENSDIVESNKEGYIKVKINWSGENDKLDTLWGYNVAKFLEETEGKEKIIKMKLKINASQVTNN